MFQDKLSSLIKEGEHLTSRWQNIYNEYPREIQNECEKAIKKFLSNDFLIYTDNEGDNPFTRVRWINERFVVMTNSERQVDEVDRALKMEIRGQVPPLLENVPTLEEKEEVESVEVPDPTYIIPNKTRGYERG